MSDKALRLMLPEPRGTFETVGEKICQELVHFQFARSGKTVYELTESGRNVLDLLKKRSFAELRKVMVQVHLRTYDNLRRVVEKHLDVGAVWRPLVDPERMNDRSYVVKLLQPSFDGDAGNEVDSLLSTREVSTAKKLENALQERVLRRVIPEVNAGIPLFRAMCDRLASLRLMNMMRTTVDECDFIKTYATCLRAGPTRSWYVRVVIPMAHENFLSIFLCEPDMSKVDTREELLGVIYEAFPKLVSQAGYFSLPEVRDFVCEQLRIPEASFDEGVNLLLDQRPSPLTAGLQYEGISARRRPLVRDRGGIQIYNLLRRA
ncbi:MAG: hypothetical protein HY665_03565 [Chloroflexi bacterium]|nr:hypothetical protein [Chloroflexota bacterium]